MSDNGEVEISKISEITRVGLREVWAYEDSDFTPWLEKNLGVLGEELGLNLTVVEREKSTPGGNFNVDLLVEDQDGRTIAVENQLDKSDHDHLGKLITYLASFQADIAIWVVAEARAEHIEAVSWLNKSSEADFYLIKLEAVRIDDSAPAPLFTQIVGPSEELKSIGRDKQEISEAGRKRFEWWNKLIHHPKAKEADRLQDWEPRKGSWLCGEWESDGTYFVYVVKKEESDVFLEIEKDAVEEEISLEIFDRLQDKRNEIEEAFGEKLYWGRGDHKSGSRIGVMAMSCGYDSPKETWEESQAEIIDAMVRLTRAIRPHLKEINSQNGEDDDCKN